MAKGLKLLFYFGPLLFAAGFLAPLTAQVIAAAGWTPPFGLSPLGCGFIVAAALGIPLGEVKAAVEFLKSEGHLYSTIDEDHHKATEA